MLVNGVQSKSFSCSRATSWAMVTGLGVGVAVFVGVDVIVGVALGVSVGVEVGVSVGTLVAVAGGGVLVEAGAAGGFASSVSAMAVCTAELSVVGLIAPHALIKIDTISREISFFTEHTPLSINCC